MSIDLTNEDWLNIEREACAQSLSFFLERAWHVLEPGQPYVHGWHLDAVAEHLEAVTNGHITRLLINIPPGTMKSLMTGVFWPAWEWGARGMPSIRFIGASHESTLATRDNLRMRRLITSEWYQTLWPLGLTTDQNEKTYFENERTGWRQSCAVKAMTGRRGDRVNWDDPHSVEDAHSAAALKEAERIFSETLPTRLNNPATSAIVVDMQRLHERDVSGLIIARDLGYEHLCLPMEYIPTTRVTGIGFKDPRTTTGELLFPARFPADVVERDKKILGPYAVAGQFQQEPAPPSGGEFQPDQISIVDAIPASVVEWCRGWDFGATTDGDYTAGVKVGRMADGRYIIADSARGRLETHKRDAMLKNIAALDGLHVKQSCPQDPGQAGKSQTLAFAKLLAGHHVHFSPETGDKQTRARPLASQVNVGNVLILSGSWNRDFIDEMRLFPFGSNDDQVDAAARAFNGLIRPAVGIFA